MATISVLVADSQRLFAQSLATALRQESDIEVLEEYPTTGGSAVDVAIRLTPAVILIDYWIPGMNAPAATRALRAWLGGKPKVLVLSWFHGPRQIEEALLEGVNGFLPKSVDLEQVVDAVRRAHAGEPLVYAQELRGLVSDINARAEDAAERLKRLKSLTPRELQVLQALAAGEPLPVAAKKLLISVGTLKNYCHKILQKTGARTQLEAIQMARYEGLVREMSPPGTSGPAFR